MILLPRMPKTFQWIDIGKGLDRKQDLESI
jgi:hypothetical protein